MLFLKLLNLLEILFEDGADTVLVRLLLLRKILLPLLKVSLQVLNFFLLIRFYNLVSLGHVVGMLYL